MAKSTITYKMDVKGIKELTKGLLERAEMETIRKIVKSNTAKLQQRAQQATGQTYMHPTGATKRGIKLALKDNGMTGIVGMTMEYNPYTELGTRFMRPRPVLKPTYMYQKIQFVNELKKSVK